MQEAPHYCGRYCVTSIEVDLQGRKKAEAPKCGEADTGRRAKVQGSCLKHLRFGAKNPAAVSFVL